VTPPALVPSASYRLHVGETSGRFDLVLVPAA